MISIWARIDEWCNTRRRHFSSGYLSPVEYEQRLEQEQQAQTNYTTVRNLGVTSDYHAVKGWIGTMENRIRAISATPLRGFFQHIVDNSDFPIDIQMGSNHSLFETSGVLKRLLSRLVKSSLGVLGVFRVPKSPNEECDIFVSYNRFLHSSKPYMIILENPVALCNYSLFAIKSPVGKFRIKRLLADKQLLKIVCICHACRDTLGAVLGCSIPPEKVKAIYPYIPDDPILNVESVISRSSEPNIKLLFIASGTRFISKGGLEILEAFKALRSQFNQVHLTIIANIRGLPSDVYQKIKDCAGITLVEACLDFDSMRSIYRSHHVLLQPSSDDSCSLTVLEAMKAGLPVVASKLYAFPEMVEDGRNGFLLEPKFWFFNRDNLPNPTVWNHRKSTLYSENIDEGLVGNLVNVVSRLITNRELLASMSEYAFTRSNCEFGTDAIFNGWTSISDELRITIDLEG